MNSENYIVFPYHDPQQKILPNSESKMSGRKRLTFLMCLCLATFFSWFYIKVSAVPNKSNLAEAVGSIEYVKATGKYGNTTRFKLKTVDKNFVYHSIGGHIKSARQLLTEQNRQIRILYDPSDSHSPSYESTSYHTVYEISSGSYVVRPYARVLEKYEENSQLAGVFAIILFGISVYLWRSE